MCALHTIFLTLSISFQLSFVYKTHYSVQEESSALFSGLVCDEVLLDGDSRGKKEKIEAPASALQNGYFFFLISIFVYYV